MPSSKTPSVRSCHASRSEPLLVTGSLSHYREPGYYTKTYAQRTEDISFYRAVAVDRGATVLEYGCGNGRITLPIAEQGLSIVGVDLCREMLADFECQLARATADVRRNVRLVHADMRQLRLRRRFGLVLCTFNTFLHLYDRNDAERFLACVRSHLETDGRFVFDVSMPDPSELARSPSRPYRVRPFRYAGTGELVRYSETFDYDPARQILFVTMRFEPVGAPRRAWTTLLAHRQYHPVEIEGLLHYNGFEVEQVVSDFGTDRLDRYTDSAVWTVRVRSDRNRGRRFGH